MLYMHPDISIYQQKAARWLKADILHHLADFWQLQGFCYNYSLYFRIFYVFIYSFIYCVSFA